ncbi:hypothetical protein GCM10027203_68320 [Nonomuraea fastidiosa]
MAAGTAGAIPLSRPAGRRQALFLAREGAGQQVIDGGEPIFHGHAVRLYRLRAGQIVGSTYLTVLQRWRP